MSVLSEIVSLTDSSEERVWHVSWHPKGTHLAAAGEDKVVRIYASATGDWGEHDSIHCISTLEDAQTRTVRCCEWSPNGKMIACASFDGTVVVWETRDASLMHWDQVASLDGHENEVKSVAWSPVGFWVATCGRDKKVWIWEQEQGSEFECVSMLDGHTQDVKFVTWHPTEAILLSCGYDDTIKIWKEDEEEFFCCETLDDHEDTVWGMTIDKASGGRQMISSCADGCLKLWECDEAHGQGAWRCKHTLDKLHRFPVYSVHWGAHYIASGGGDDDITLLRVTKGGAYTRGGGEWPSEASPCGGRELREVRPRGRGRPGVWGSRRGRYGSRDGISGHQDGSSCSAQPSCVGLLWGRWRSAALAGQCVGY